MAWLFGSLAPATACAALTLFIFNSQNYGGSPGRGPTLSMILSNPNYAASESSDFHKGENDWSFATFDWTSHSSLTSNVGSFLRLQ